MASGKLGSVDLTANTYATVYTVPAGTVSTLNVAIVNRGSTEVSVRVALTTETTTPTDADFIEYDAVVPATGGVLERTALVAGAGEKVMVRSTSGDVSVRVHGFEEEV